MSDQKFSAPTGERRPAADTILRFVPPALGVVTAVCYALAMMRDFAFSIGHFEPSSVLFLIVEIASVLGILTAACLALCTSGRAVLTAVPAPGPLSVFGAVLGAVLSAALCVRNLICYEADLAAETAETLSPVKLALGASVCGLFLTAGLLLALSKDGRHRWYSLIAILLGVFSVNVSMFAAYFDFAVPLNSPVRNLTTLCQASVLLFLLSEARIALSDEEKPEELPPAFQLFTSVTCAVFGIGIGGGGALWRLIRSFAFGSEIIDKSPEPNLPLLRLVLYAAVGLIAADRILHSDLRFLSKEEIAANREKAREKARQEKEKKKKPAENHHKA